jgi:hypothetical protein
VHLMLRSLCSNQNQRGVALLHHVPCCMRPEAAGGNDLMCTEMRHSCALTMLQNFS